MIEIRITGYTLQECLDQINGISVKPTEEVKPVVETPVEKTEPKQEGPSPKEVALNAQKITQKTEKALQEKKEEEIPTVKEEKKEEKKEEIPAVEEPKEINRDMAWDVANRVKNEVSLGALRLILSEFKAQKFAQLNPLDYELFYKACLARIAEEGK